MNYYYPVQPAVHQPESINIKNAEPSEYSSPDYVVENIVPGDNLASDLERRASRFGRLAKNTARGLSRN